MLERWRRGGRGSGKLPDQTPVLAGRFHDRGGGGGQKGTYVCEGGRGIWTGPWLTLVLTSGPSGALRNVGYVEFLSTRILFVFLEETNETHGDVWIWIGLQCDFFPRYT